MGIDVENVDGVKRTIIKMADAIDAGVELALEKSAMKIERDAKANCPVNTGMLRSSIGYEVSTGENLVAIEVGTDIPYSCFIEYGTGLFAKAGNGRQTPWTYMDEKGNFYRTHGQHPQPFLEPAIYDNWDDVMQSISEAIKQAVKEAQDG